MDAIYRIPVFRDTDFGFCDVTVEPNPYGDPHTVKITFPASADAWAILPRSMFSDEVNKRTTVSELAPA